MSTFAPIALPHIAPPDPSKHVKYQLGTVLGVDDFDQEFHYLAERDRRIVRDLIGYGVISGLHVTVAPACRSAPAGSSRRRASSSASRRRSARTSRSGCGPTSRRSRARRRRSSGSRSSRATASARPTRSRSPASRAAARTSS